MAISTRCPHCDKSYNLKDALAGKRVYCTNPVCKKAFNIPAKATVASGPASNGSVKSGASIEEMALAALVDDKKPEPAAEAQAQSAAIAVKCPHCDFISNFESRMAGKNAPCQNEECRKIIKVPLPKKDDPKDWRTVQARPSAAKVEAPQIEGAWGNIETTAVSREAIVQAAADRVEEEPEPRSWTKRIIIALTSAGVLLLLVVGVLWIMRKRVEGKQEDALQYAMEYVGNDPKSKKTKLGKEPAGMLRLLAGQYELSKDRPKEAKEHLIAARGGIDTPGTIAQERFAALVDVAATQASLAGNAQKIAEGKRFDWNKDKLMVEVRSTLTRLPAATSEEYRELRSFALRRVTRALVAAEQAPAAGALANAVAPAEERAEQLAVVGLELLALGQRDQAYELAKQASVVPSESPSLLSLWLALGSPDQPAEKQKEAVGKAGAIAVLPPAGAVPTPLVRVGYSTGWALQGNFENGRKMAWASGRPDERLRAGIAVAAVVILSRPNEHTDLELCVKALEGELKGRSVSNWQLMRLLELCLRVNKPDLGERVVAAISDEGLRAWGAFEVLKGKLNAQQPAEVAPLEMAAEIGAPRETGKPELLAHWLAIAAVARHNAKVRGSGSVMKDIRNWDPEPRRPFGFVGVALSEQ